MPFEMKAVWKRTHIHTPTNMKWVWKMTLITPSFKREFEIFNRNEPNFHHYFEQSHTSKLYFFFYNFFFYFLFFFIFLFFYFCFGRKRPGWFLMKVSHVLGPLPSVFVAPSIWPKKDNMFKLYVLFLLLSLLACKV